MSDNSDKSDRSEKSDPSEREHSNHLLIPKHGGYRRLKSFQVAEIVYDGTVVFCDRFISKRSRTYDQMVQAARSGRQNIAEGSMASGTSKRAELKLTGVAKASLEELLLDFEDYLRQRGLSRWAKDSREALAVRFRYRLGSSETSDRSAMSDESDMSDPYGISAATPETAANTLICLINQATYLLKRQLRTLERAFVEQGGFTEELHRERSRTRSG
jgi:four helix bundle suffix protein